MAVQNNAKDGVASVNKALLADNDELRAIGKLVTRIRDTDHRLLSGLICSLQGGSDLRHICPLLSVRWPP